MNFVTNFLSEYGNTIIYALLTAFAAFLAARVKATYERIEADRTKKAVVETCVKAVEQLYQDLHGADKLEKACENIRSVLSEKGIYISELEMQLLIEACVAEFNFNFNKEDK